MAMMDFQGPSFIMKVPTTWYVTSTPQVQAMFVAPPFEDGSYANLMITLHPVSPDVSLEEVVANARKTQEKEYKEYEVLEEQMMEETTPPRFERIYTWFNEQHGKKIYQRQEVLIAGEMLYTLTATRTVSESEEVKRIDALLKNMMETFELR